MLFDLIVVPDDGEEITEQNGKLIVPDKPIICFIERDGIGYDIMTASKRIWDAAVKKAYGGQRKIAWMEIYAGEKVASIYDGNYMPEETFAALREYLIGIKGPLTTPVGGGFRSPNVILRQVLDLYSCIRPARWYKGVPSPLRLQNWSMTPPPTRAITPEEWQRTLPDVQVRIGELVAENEQLRRRWNSSRKSPIAIRRIHHSHPRPTRSETSQRTSDPTPQTRWAIRASRAPSGIGGSGG